MHQGKFLFAARVIPYRGSWLDFEFDPKDILNVRIDRKRKLPCTTFLMALLEESSEKHLKDCIKNNKEPERDRLVGMTREDILDYFYDQQIFKFENDKWTTNFLADNYKGQRLNFDLIDSDKNMVVGKAGDKITQRDLKKLLDNGLKSITINEDELIGKFLAEDIINENTGEVYAEAGDEITQDLIELFKGLTNLFFKSFVYR